MNEDEGNRCFKFAMIALEGGDFAKSERLLKETVEHLGKESHTSLLAMKTIAGIASEQGRIDDALQTSLDLLDSQIKLFGVNHAESTRTIRNVLELCKQNGADEVAQEISMLAQVASDMEKNQTTQSFHKLRHNKDEDIEKETLKLKIAKLLARILPDVEVGESEAESARQGVVYIFVGVVITIGVALFFINASFVSAAAYDFRRAGLEFDTLDNRKRLEFVSQKDVVVNNDSLDFSTHFRALAWDWLSIPALLTTSVLDREHFLISCPEGLREIGKTVYYRPGAPETELLSHMKEVMKTAEHYFEHKSKYPRKIEQISETKFQFQNPFSREMDEPSIQIVRLGSDSTNSVADFIDSLRQGALCPGEEPLRPGAIRCYRIIYDTTGAEQFFVRGCDRYGHVMTGGDSNSVLLESKDGMSADKAIAPAVSFWRTPNYWIIPSSAELEVLLPLLRYRFILIYGLLTLMFYFLYKRTRSDREKSVGLLAFLLSLIGCLVALASTFLP